jgi:hypothetical protein
MQIFIRFFNLSWKSEKKYGIDIQKEKGGITTDGIFSRISIIDTWIKIGIK